MNTRLARFLAALVGSAALIAASAPAHAAVITFDGAPAPLQFAEAQPLTSQFSALGVTFSGTGAVLNKDVDFMVTGFSGDNFLAYNSEAPIGFGPGSTVSKASDVFTFSTPLDALSFKAGSGLPLGAGRTLQVRAFNAANMLIDSEEVTLQSALQTVSLSGMAITRVTLAAGLDFDDEEGVGFVVDDINTAPGAAVPEPASIVLLGSALAGVLVSRRPRTRR